MVNVEELENQINDYVLDLILKSKVEDWDYQFQKDNIIINTEDNKFYVKFKNNRFVEYEYYIEFYDSRFKYLFNKDKRNLNKKLKLKYKEIRYYIENNSKIQKMQKIIDTFPDKIKRKQKLENLNSAK